MSIACTNKRYNRSEKAMMRSALNMHFKPLHHFVKCVLSIKESYSKGKRSKLFTNGYGQSVFFLTTSLRGAFKNKKNGESLEFGPTRGEGGGSDRIPNFIEIYQSLGGGVYFRIAHFFRRRDSANAR